ncbi:phosphoribosylamine-glycine ligase [Enterococcus asini ATCC 700915]|uniref:Phosphoribosylamine--glycine ligase n=1 Tax=Enterococcus asini ATCC 700915 TaxID=1158606 RepID=R2PUB6_9ENTE|nr:phosphoribosylamine--glycine ligase [Enterococcus asini]EOH88162.1 phosphoribosylamine-glycine ligase [Enterococcus asini ATCC 700915]EOT55959.1 phosphoribosylamine-glycine ligase [Enterococcus asini ATCC 700915]
MKLLVIGSGGREHTIAKKLKSDPGIAVVFCAPGNPGMKKDGIEVVAVAESDHQGLIAFAKEQGIDWTFVGPEAPLAAGLVDDFEAAGLKAFGPSKKAAQIEGSKDFAKQLMLKNQIPTAKHQTFTDFAKAKAYVEAQGAPIVIKADGLAAGKGVVVAETVSEAVAALSDMLEGNKFGASGARVVVEEFLAGEEFSLLAFVRNEKVYPMVISQDHKRAYDGDKGPNTGGMGAYSPVPQIPTEMVARAVTEILEPAALGMIKNGTPFTGILYAGLIATDEGAKVIEFNARFGDPETQVVVPRLTSSLAAIITALLADEEPVLTWSEQATFGVVVAAEGYPGTYAKGMVLPEITSPDVSVYYAGVAEKDGQLVASGGRIFLVEAKGDTLADAREKVYGALDGVDLSQMFYRKDIGAKALK